MAQYQAKVTATFGLNIRTGPGTNHPILATAPPNEVLTIDSEGSVGSWRKVVAPYEGFAWGSFLMPLPAEYRVTATSGLRIRSAPSTSGTIITVAPTGSILQVNPEETVGDWLRIVAPHDGYAHKNHLVLVPQNEEPFVFTHWPVDSRVITQPYGANPQYYQQFGLPGHEGLDFRAPHGAAIYAVAPGTVYRIIEERKPASQGGHNYGVHVRIRHTQGYATIYAHLHCHGVRVGQVVQGGQLLGLSDNTGNSSGAHLHLTLKRDGTIIDPTPFLNAVPQ